TDSTLTLLQGGTALPGSSAIAFGTSSACSSVNAATPMLTVTRGASTMALPGFTPTLTAGHPATFVALPKGDTVVFATLAIDFTPAAGQAGFRVFNGSGIATAFDVFVTAPGAVLAAPPTVANVATGASSAFVSADSGSKQIRLTATGSLLTPIDLGTQTLTGGQNITLIIAPPAKGTTTARGVLVPACWPRVPIA